MRDCWLAEPGMRPSFAELAEKIASVLTEGSKGVSRAILIMLFWCRYFDDIILMMLFWWGQERGESYYFDHVGELVFLFSGVGWFGEEDKTL